MSKPEWGEKRECPECGARFYDLNRSQIVCPKCDAQFVAVVEKAPPTKDKPNPNISTPSVEGGEVPKVTGGDDGDDKIDEFADIEIDDGDDMDDDTDDLIEDSVDLDDNDDMSDVLDVAIDETKTAE